MKKKRLTRSVGFSMVEATVIAAVLGILAVFAVPHYSSNVERGKASDAFTFLAQVESAQTRFHLKHGAFGQRLSDLDVRIVEPVHFETSEVSSIDWTTCWQLRLTRRGSGYGAYTVVFDQAGFSDIKSSIPAALMP